jgi:uncharacterized protein YjbI with pentapeptide repeats
MSKMQNKFVAPHWRSELEAAFILRELNHGPHYWNKWRETNRKFHTLLPWRWIANKRYWPNFSLSSHRGTGISHSQALKLAEMDFANLSLAGADLSGIDFSFSNFSNSDLRQADFHGADLSFCYFQFTNLQEANFCGALMIGTRFESVNLKGTNFTNVLMEGCHFSDGLIGAA